MKKHTAQSLGKYLGKEFVAVAEDNYIIICVMILWLN